MAGWGNPVLAGVRLGVLAIVLALAGATAAGVVVRDTLGRTVALAAPPARIVSLVPSVTEIVFAVGAEGRLAGVTDYCDFPPAARRKPSVGGMVAPSLETIATLRPDLVIGTDEGTREEIFSEVTRLGIPVFLVHAHGLADVLRVIRTVGTLTAREEAARELAASIERRVAAVGRAVAGRPRPRVLYVVWPEPLIVPGREAIVTELIRLAGGDSVTAGDGDAYPRFSLEAAVARDPEVIVLATHGAGTGPVSKEKFERFASVAAVRSGRLYTVDGNLLHRYGPRVVEGLEQLARAIHPEAFR